MTQKQHGVLRSLEYHNRRYPDVPTTPMYLGGMDGSHHSATLAQLCKKGLAKRRKHTFFGDCQCKCGPEAQFGHRCKGSFTYTITEEGKRYLKEQR